MEKAKKEARKRGEIPFDELVCYVQDKEESRKSLRDGIWHYKAGAITSSNSDVSSAEPHHTYQKNVRFSNQNENRQNAWNNIKTQNQDERYNGFQGYKNHFADGYKSSAKNYGYSAASYQPQQSQVKNMQASQPQQQQTQNNQQAVQNYVPNVQNPPAHDSRSQNPSSPNKQFMIKNRQRKNQSKTTKLDNESIMGKLMLGSEVVAYLFDTGADRSALSIRVIEKMGLTSELKKYDGKQLHSANGLVKALGILRTECLISETIKIQQAEFLVIENLEKVDCILGLDLIGKIPKIKVEYKAVQSIVNEMTAEIVMRKQMLDKSACEDKRNENAVQQPTSSFAICELQRRKSRKKTQSK